jgi:transposase
MDAPTLPPELPADLPPAARADICWQEARVAELKARVADLEAKLYQNSTNSSKPPPSDPPAVKRAPDRPPTGKKPGGQPAHPPDPREGDPQRIGRGTRVVR